MENHPDTEEDHNNNDTTEDIIVGDQDNLYTTNTRIVSTVTILAACCRSPRLEKADPHSY